MRRKISLKARRYISGEIRRQFVKKRKGLPQSIAIAYSKARRKGFYIPKRRK